jgi:OOP family OmpA-OmpF porin
MKAKHLINGLLLLVFAFVVSGCASVVTQETMSDTCTSKNANALIRQGYQKKVDNFIIVQDASATMGERGQDKFDYDAKINDPYNYFTKLNDSTDLLNCLNNSMPDNFDVMGGMRVFGPTSPDKGLVYGMTDYTKAGLLNAISGTNKTGGVTPIANALITGGYDLLDTPGLTDNPGPTAMILFSDGMNTESSDPVAAASAVKQMYGNNICIYTVLIGESSAGKAVMEQIADASNCGYATDSSKIGNPAGMDQFVVDVFLVKVAKPAAKPAYRPPEKISMTLLIEFDFDKDVVRPQHHGDVKRIADMLNKYPGAKAELEGHTDNMGTDAYNMDLSKRRVENVKKYLAQKFNISPSRVSTVAYGESKPVASNKTSEGRQRNRRVVANIQ